MTYVTRHPEEVHFQKGEYSNVITMGIPDHVAIANRETYFPEGRLMVNRMSNHFVSMHGELLDYFFDMTEKGKPDYREVWITTGYLPKKQLYLLELSYE
ncbi:hypothetical protein LOSG293_460010 [Secundilactobacillus oryzae JCM 18671]|uniref:Uncharacterized protein n=2 Tax=Secundilactobacillus oryzae TaxID=1202668 RepID=A0A081BKU5_9LACO|nr:hypothetical protein LOSG293_460010 [Secundilactobacillus oryzae JCM 18671]